MEIEIISRALNGDNYLVEDILRKGISSNTQDIEGTTALHVACANNNIGLVQLLLKYGVNVNLSNSCGWTPLMIAAYYKNTCIVELLLEHKAQIEIKNKLGMTALIAAACNGHLPTLTLLLKNTKNPLDQLESYESSNEISLLKAAILYEQEDCVRYLLDNKIDCNKASPITKTTDLMLTAAIGNKEIARVLVDNGADPNLVNVCHQTAHEISSTMGFIELKSYLSERTLAPIPYTAQSEAQISDSIMKGDINSITSIIKSNNSLVNFKYSKDGLNPLTQSVILCKKEIVLSLLQYGAHINIQDSINNYTALMHAVNNRKFDMVKLLLEHGASLEIQGKGGCTALDLAWRNEGCKDIADLLVAWGKKSRGKKLSVPVMSESFSPRMPILKSRNSFRNSLRHDSFKGLVGSISQRFQHLRNRKSSGREASSSPIPSFTDESVDDNVFVESNTTPEPYHNSIGNGLKLSSFDWPSMKNIKGIQEYKKTVLSPFMPNLPALANTIPGEYRPTLKECILANQKRNCREGIVPGHIEKRLNPNSRKPSNMKFDLSFSKSSDSSNIIVPSFPSIVYSPGFKDMQIKPQDSNIDRIKRIEDMLRLLSLEVYTKMFQENEIDLQAFRAVTDADLVELGIHNKNHRRKLLQFALNF